MGTACQRVFKLDTGEFKNSGILLADGVGMGKTYEALTTAFAWLQRKSSRREKFAPKVLVLLPAQLVRKWRDEVCLPDRWQKYIGQIKNLQGKQKKIYKCFSTPIIIESTNNLWRLLDNIPGKSNRLGGGFYVVNWNQLGQHAYQKKYTRRRNLLKNTQWDVVIVDEAHLFPGSRLEFLSEISRHKGTRLVLLTATPFQLEVKNIIKLLQYLFLHKHGTEKSGEAAKGLYRFDNFAAYRDNLAQAMDEKIAPKLQLRYLRVARKAKKPTEKILKRLIIRNLSTQKRAFYFVNKQGISHEISAPSGRLEGDLRKDLSKNIIEFNPSETYYYLAGLERLLPYNKKECLSNEQFNGFRHLLSSYGNFQNSKIGNRRITNKYAISKYLEIIKRKDIQHPKIEACANLVERIISSELKKVASGKKPVAGKVVVFVRLIDKTTAKLRHEINMRLERIVDKYRQKGMHPYIELGNYVQNDFKHLFDAIKDTPQIKGPIETEALNKIGRLRTIFKRRRTKGFARALSMQIFSNRKILAEEKKLLKSRIANIMKDVEAIKKISYNNEIEKLSLESRIVDILDSLCDRYKAVRLVTEITGKKERKEIASARAAFNSPGAPLVLVSSSIGQVGVDLQAYAEHVVHYDIEWNPARMEQREGRVDRLGRKSDSKVKVYYLIVRDSYDERIFIQTSRRQLWHKLLIGKNKKLKAEFDENLTDKVANLTKDRFNKVALDLRPQKV